MKNLRNLLRETAAAGSTGAGSIAGSRGLLFGGKPAKRVNNSNTIKVQRIKFHNDSRGLSESLLKQFLDEKEDGNFKNIDILSKLKAAQANFDFGKDSTAFGLEDEEGNTVKIYVRYDQAEQFERTLSEILHDSSEEKQEIPEIIFNLKDKFDIVHVDWGRIEEDEEETQGPDQEGGQPSLDQTADSSGEQLDLDQSTDGADDSTSEDSEDTDSGDESSILDKVISMLKADADARTAEAKAKEAEYNSKEAEYAAKAAEEKIKGEEEVLDMETYFKQQNDEKKEATKLAKLARFRHEKALEQRGQETDDEMDTDEL
jgi:hypothetical protein